MSDEAIKVFINTTGTVDDIDDVIRDIMLEYDMAEERVKEILDKE